MRNLKVKLGKKQIVIAICITLLILISIVSIVLFKMNKKNTIDTNELNELVVSKTYKQVQEGDDVTQSEYVKFDAYVLKDLNSDGIAEKLRGTCKKIGSQDTLYMELNINSSGTLKDGKITVNGENFYLTTALIADNIIKENVISKNTEKILLNDIKQGTNTLIYGTIKSGDYSYNSTIAEAIKRGNINNYSVDNNTIIFTATYVDENGQEIEIKKQVNLSVDWYGDISTSIENKYQNYELDYNNSNLKFYVSVKERNQELMLSKMHLEADIPQLNGYDPINVTVQGGEYDSNTRKIMVEKTSNIWKEKYIVNEIANYYNIEVNVEYPQEAFLNMEDNSNLIFNIPVTAYYEGYNNKKIYETGISCSKDTSEIVVTYSEYIPNASYVYSSSIYGVFDKRKVINAYENNENILNDRYEVVWNVARINDTESDNIIIKQDKLDQMDDKAIESINNIGIYFSGNIAGLIGENGVIKLYNNKTNELIKEFNKDNWCDTYLYDQNVKEIRIEISNVISVKDGELGTIGVHNIKEIDSKQLSQELTIEELIDIGEIRNYSSIITGNSVTAIARSQYISPTSNVNISTSVADISTQIKTGMVLNISATNEVEQSWKDGKFLIKFPSQIINIDIQSIRSTSSLVEITKFNQYKENGNVYIEIETENKIPTNFSLIVDISVNCDPLVQTVSENIEVYACNPENEIYDRRVSDIYDINKNGLKDDYVTFDSSSINIVAPNSLLTTENIIDGDGNVLAKPSQSLEVDKDELLEQRTVEVKILNNYAGEAIKDTIILGKIGFLNNTYIISGNEMGSNYTVSMVEGGIKIPEELKGKVKVYYSEKEEVNKNLNDISNGWIETPSDFSKIKTYVIDLSEITLSRGEGYSFTYDINIPTNLEYNQSTYSTHAVYFNLITEEGKLQQKIETNKLGIFVARRFNLNITDYEELTTEAIEGVTYKIEGLEDTRIITTDKDGKAVIDGLYVEKEYTITKMHVPTSYELDKTVRKIRTYLEGDSLKVENISGDFVSQNIVQSDKIATINVVLENKAKVMFYISKIDKHSTVGIADVKFELKGKGISENGAILNTNNQGEVLVTGLYQNEIYTLKEIYAKGYKEVAEDIKFKVYIDNNNYRLEIVQGKTASSVIKKEQGSIPRVEITIENEKIDSYKFNLRKVEKNSSEIIEGTKFKITGKWIEDGQTYVTDENGNIYIDLYEGYEYTLTEIEPAEGYALDSQEIKFIVVKDSEGNLQCTVTQGKFKNEPYINNNAVHVEFENDKLFTIKKEDEETGKLLKGVKFAIYEVTRQEGELESLSEAIDRNGQVVGNLETINGIEYRVLETDENGTISENLRAGLYKAIEVQALDGYYLGELEEYTYYFGIEESHLGDSTITLKMELPNVLQDSIIQTNDGGYIGVIDNKITKYNCEFKEEWTSTSEIISQVYYNGYQQVVQVNDGGYVAISKSGFLSKYSSSGLIEWEKEVQIEGNIGDIITTKDGNIIVAVGKDESYWAGQYNEYGVNGDITLIKYDILGNILWQKGYFQVNSAAHVYSIGLIEDNSGNIIIYFCTENGGEEDGIIKADKDGNRLWERFIRNGPEYVSACLSDDGGYILVGYAANNMHEYGVQVANSNVIAKYSKHGELEWIKEAVSVTRGELQWIQRLKDGSYVLADTYNVYKYSRDFVIEAVYYSSAYLNNGNLSKHNIYLLDNNEVIVASRYNDLDYCYKTSILEIKSGEVSIPKKQEIIVYNKLKEYNITTFAQDNGTISGNGNMVYEKVKYGKDSTKEIIVTPNKGYKIKTISINGEYIDFKEESDGSVTLQQLKNITEDKNIYATFIPESEYGEVIVKHYKTGMEEEVAESQKIRGKVDDTYVTSPKMDIESFNVNTKALPDNAIGKIKKDTTEVIYYYDHVPIKIVTNYINVETNEKMQESTTQYKNIGEEYITKGIENIPEGYKLIAEPSNSKGIITGNEEKREIEVTYYYRLKQYIIKTEVEGIGGTITGQGKDVYEIVKHGNDSMKEIVVTPNSGYEVSNIKINGKDISYNKNQDGTVTLDKIIGVKEDKIITVEFKKIDSKVIIKYLDSKTKEEIQNAEEKIGEVGQEYIVVEKDIQGYRLINPIPENAKGVFTEDIITVEFYYEEIECKVIVKYLEKDTNNKLLEDTVIKGRLGEQYQTLRENISGYKAVEEEPKNAKGIFEEGIIEVIYYYEKIIQNNDDNLENNDKEDNINQNDTKEDKFFKDIVQINPSTGDKIIIAVIAIIVVIIVNIVIIVIFKRKEVRYEKNQK